MGLLRTNTCVAIFVLISCLIHVLENQREEIRAMYLGQHPNAFWVNFAEMLDVDNMGFNVKVSLENGMVIGFDVRAASSELS